jgi:hypothetical protein
LNDFFQIIYYLYVIVITPSRLNSAFSNKRQEFVLPTAI